MNAISTANPPTAPPAMAPTFVCGCELGKIVADELDEVVDEAPTPATVGLAVEVVLAEELLATISTVPFKAKNGAALVGLSDRKAPARSSVGHCF